MENPIFKKLKKELKLLLQKGNNNNTVTPAIKDSKGNLQPVDFANHKKNTYNKNLDPVFKRVWDWWMNNTYDKPDSFNNTRDRYNDLNFAYYNSGIFSAAVDLLSDETINAESNEEPIQVFAKNKKFEKAIKELFNSIGLDQQKLSAIAHNISLYGDSYLINSVDAKLGVTKIIPNSPYGITERIEFTLSRAIEQYAQKFSYVKQLTSKSKAIQQLYQMYTDNTTTDISQIFESFLFGFVVGEDTVLPPWGITHFRRFSNESEFYPYGKSPFIHAIAPYRQYAATKNIVAMGRIAAFPILHFKVKTSEEMTEAEQWEVVNDVRQEFANIGVTNTGKDEFTINDKIWTPKELLDVTPIENRIEFENIDDLKIFLQELLVAVRIPKGIIPIGDDNGWGNSGKALVQQHKMFARMVYVNQQAIINGLINLVKIHFSILGEFEDEVFEISLPYPLVEESDDRQRFKSDSIRLAKDIIDNIGQSLGLDRDETLPIQVVKDIFSTYSFLSNEDIEIWIKEYEKEVEEKEKEDANQSEEENTNIYKEKKKKEKLTLKLYRKSKDNIIRYAYFDALNEKGVKEFTRGQRHFITSIKVDKNEKYIYEFLNKKIKVDSYKLKEGYVLQENEINVSECIELNKIKRKRKKN